MTILHIDIETYSECDLGSAGVYRYAEHPSTELTCIGYAIDDGPVKQWKPGEEIPDDFFNCWIDSSVELRAHNAQFERVVINGTAGKKVELPPSKIERWTCTAAKVAAAGLPRALGDAAKALGTHAKAEAGRIEMLQIAKPRKPTKADPSTRWTRENAPEKWAAMFAYNLDDVEAERAIDNAIPDLTENEQRLYHLDQKINERGWKVDLEAVNNILFVVEEYKATLEAECRSITEDWMGNSIGPSQRAALAEWVRANGFPGLVDMTAEYIRQVIKRPDLPENVKRLLVIYSTYNAKSVSKLQAMLDAVCADGRLRGMFMFYGAATGRWSSLIVQLQNMMRPLIKDTAAAIEAFASRSVEWLQFLYGGLDLMKVAGSCIRGCLVADDGCDIVAPDYSGVEDRGNAWVHDEQWVLDAYRAYDEGKGRHLYSITVCRWFGFDLDNFSDEDPRRQWGKVGRLALGYEGGVSAFSDMVDTYGINLEDMAATVLPLLPEAALDHAAWMRKNHPNSKVSGDVETACNGLKFLWRRDHPHIVQGWKNLKEAAEKAVEFEGQVFATPNRKVAFKVEEYKGRKWLSMRLPSGRKVRYFNPTWTPPKESERWLNGVLEPYTIPGYLEYQGIDTYTRQWMRLQTYGGKLDENVVQAFCRDLLAHAMLELDAAGYTIVGSEHDKPILEVGPEGSVDEIKRLMLAQPDYCEGLPLATDGKRMKRYGK
jgi:DNA polymerase